MQFSDAFYFLLSVREICYSRLAGVDEGYMKISFWKRVYRRTDCMCTTTRYIYLFRKLWLLQLPRLISSFIGSFIVNMVILWIGSSWRNKRIKKKRRFMSLRRQPLYLYGLSWKYWVKWTEHISALNSDKNDKKALVTLKDGSKCHNKYLEGLNEINMV